MDPTLPAQATLDKLAALQQEFAPYLGKRYPLTRNNRKVYLENGKEVYPPYERIITEDGPMEYCCGFAIEHFRDKTKLIEDCLTRDSMMDRIDHNTEHEYFEIGGRINPRRRNEFNSLTHICGYCSKAECRKKDRRALSAGQYVKFNCLTCLADKLDGTYAGAELGTCGILCLPDSRYLASYPEQTSNHEKLDLRLQDGKAHMLDNQVVEGYFIRVPPRPQRQGSGVYWRMPWVFVVTSPLFQPVNKACPSQRSLYVGLFRGHLKGRYVCQNIALDLPCEFRNLRYTEKRTRFSELITPSYYPTWRELDMYQDNLPAGSIQVAHHCWGCTCHNVLKMLS